jgi:alkylation response protein AidB-like acyl-CoA dehydrogenase
MLTVATYPTEREAKRRALLEAVARLQKTLEAHIEVSEAEGKLAQASVEAFQAAGLYGLKLPASLGGLEADPLLQIDVIEAVSRIHPTAGWNLFICGTGTGLAGAFLPEAGLAQMFSGTALPIAAGVLRPRGQATPVSGGYQVSGRWPFASGIRNSTWFCAGTTTPNGETRMLAIPVTQVQIHDNWQVFGLQGTGSCDVSIHDLFVPQECTWVAWEKPQRGGPLYRLGRPAFLAAEHAACALGTGRLALDAIIALAQNKQRGYAPTAPTIAQRPAFQSDLAAADLQLRAARALLVEVYEDVWATACAGQLLSPQQQRETRSATCYATQVAVDVATLAFRYGGGEANYLASRLQQALRDVHGAAQHQIVSNDAYEEHAQGLLGM